MTERIVKASFSDGTVLERKAYLKVYTHAWLAKGEPAWKFAGFASSKELAGSNMAKEIGKARQSTMKFSEIVAVEVIEKQEAA
jgi:hypothetical protein